MDANPTTTADSTKADTVDQAKRMAAALQRRQRTAEDLVRWLREIFAVAGREGLERACYHGGEEDDQTKERLDELRELLAEHAVANRDFEAAVFEHAPQKGGVA